MVEGLPSVSIVGFNQRIIIDAIEVDSTVGRSARKIDNTFRRRNQDMTDFKIFNRHDTPPIVFNTLLPKLLSEIEAVSSEVEEDCLKPRISDKTEKTALLGKEVTAFKPRILDKTKAAVPPMKIESTAASHELRGKTKEPAILEDKTAWLKPRILDKTKAAVPPMKAGSTAASHELRGKTKEPAILEDKTAWLKPRILDKTKAAVPPMKAGSTAASHELRGKTLIAIFGVE